MRTLLAYTLLNALRDRLLHSFGLLLLCTVAIAQFFSATALVEKSQTGIVLFAGASRLLLVIGGALWITLQIDRCYRENTFTLLLSRPISRFRFLLCYAFSIAFVLTLLWALTVGLFVLLFETPSYFGQWSLLLLNEMWLMGIIAFSLALGLRRLFPSLLAFIGFYIFFRMMPDFLMAADSPLMKANNGEIFIGYLMRCLSYITPRLENFASSHWLLPDALAPSLLFPFFQTILFIGLFFILAYAQFRHQRISRI